MLYEIMARYKILQESGIYFTTHTIVSWLPVFKEIKYFNIIIDSLNFCQRNKGLTIYGYVIMLNHFHLMAQTREGINFQDVLRDMKKHTSKHVSHTLDQDNENEAIKVLQDKINTIHKL